MPAWWTSIRRRLSRRDTSEAPAQDDLSDEWLAMMGRVAADSEARRRALAGMEDIVASVMKALYEADPVGLAELGSPEDEYESEAETIVMRLADRREIVATDDAVTIVYEEFVRWFDDDMAGDRARYESVGADVHRLWQAYLIEGG